MLAQNLAAVRDRIRDTAGRCGRDPNTVRLVAVSKTFGTELIRAAALAGQVDFGENYAQEFREKAEALRDAGLRWHFIGHLQSNKVRLIIRDASMVHSLDSVSLGKELQKRAELADRTVDVLVEVHTTAESAKSGVAPGAVPALLRELVPFDRLRVRGLMTMGPFADDPEQSRPCFRQLRELRERLKQDGPPNMRVEELSMGMTADLDVAIEEGATIVRVGTAIFGRRTAHTT